MSDFEYFSPQIPQLHRLDMSLNLRNIKMQK